MSTAASTPVTGTYLTFQLANEEFGIEILKVREIIEMLPITPVPGSPGVMLGVINLRGKVIPVLSMRLRFTMAPAEPHPHNVIIVVDGGDGGQVGLAVDRIREVATFAAGETEAPPSYGLQVDANLVAAIGKSQNRIRVLLDLERVLAIA